MIAKCVPHYRGALAAVGGAAYGTADYTTVDIVMDEVQCSGTEMNLTSCRHAAVHDCDVNEAASVQCVPNDGRISKYTATKFLVIPIQRGSR